MRRMKLNPEESAQIYEYCNVIHNVCNFVFFSIIYIIHIHESQNCDLLHKVDDITGLFSTYKHARLRLAF